MGFFFALSGHFGSSWVELWVPMDANGRWKLILLKNSQQDLGGKVSAAGSLGSGARVKAHVLEKASLIPRENGIPATWRKRGPLGKGNY